MSIDWFLKKHSIVDLQSYGILNFLLRKENFFQFQWKLLCSESCVFAVWIPDEKEPRVAVVVTMKQLICSHTKAVFVYEWRTAMFDTPSRRNDV